MSTTPQIITNPTIDVFNADGTHSMQTVTGNAYKITTEDEWLYIVENSSTWSSIIYFDNDIFFTTSNVASIGSSAAFTGKIYGNGHKLYNFVQSFANAHGLIWKAGNGCELNYLQFVNAKVEGTTSTNTGILISYVNQNASIVLRGCSVSYSTLSVYTNYSGVFMGYIQSSSGCTIDVQYCTIDHVYVMSNGYMGAVAGFVNNQGCIINIVGCTIKTSKFEALKERAVGSCVGYLYQNNTINITNVRVENCVFKACHTAGFFEGGLIGIVHGSSTANINGCVIDCCTIKSNISGTAGFVGSILGAAVFSGTKSTISNTWIERVTGTERSYAPFYGSGAVTLSVNPEHSKVWTNANNVTVSTVATDNLLDKITTITDAHNNGVGSIIERESFVVGVDYGYGCFLTNAHNGAKWVDAVMHIHNGTEFVKPNSMYRYNGTSWQLFKGGVCYTTKNYIVATGTQFIDVGFTPNYQTKIHIDMAPDSTGGGSSYQDLFGARVGSQNQDLELYYEVGSAKWYIRYSAESVEITSAMSFNNRHLIKMETSSGVDVDGTHFNVTPNDGFNATRPLYIFSLNNNGSEMSSQRSCGKLYSFKLWDNWKLILNMIPCQLTATVPIEKCANPARSHVSGDVGMWDLIGDKFYGNSGTGVFTAG